MAAAAAVVQRSSVRRRHLVLAPLVLLAVVAASGCGGKSAAQAASCENPKVVEERTVDLSYDGPVADSSELADPDPGLVVQMVNTEPSIERVRLNFDGATALDVDLPAAADCDPGEPVFSVAYARSPGPVDVALDLQGETSTTSIEVPASGPVWVVVDATDRNLTVFDARPGWG